MAKMHAYMNGLGEELTAPIRAEFKGVEAGYANFVVVWDQRRREYIVLRDYAKDEREAAEADKPVEPLRGA